MTAAATANGGTAGGAAKSFGAAKDAFTQGTGKAKAFAKARPGATAALAGVIGLALFNTLRGR